MTPAHKRSTTVVLTFDYELFYVGGTVRRCMVQPVDALLAVLDEIGARAAFFVDAPALVWMEGEPRASADLASVADQIGRMVSAGHRVELHAHPQWLDAVWEGDRWTFDPGRSHMLTDLEPGRSLEFLRSSSEALLRAVRAADPGYVLEAYRAAGLCAQPFDAVREGMLDLGLTIDSSVAPGMARSTDVHVFDYRDAPRGACWRFDDDSLRPVDRGRFAELPMTCWRTSFAAKVLRRLDRAGRPKAYEIFGDGTWLPSRPTHGAPPPSKVIPITLEMTPPSVLARALGSAGDIVTTVSHPKAMSEISLESLRWLAATGVRFALPAEVVAESCPE